MILIQEAITYGTWMHCEWKEHKINYQFRVRILSFRKLSLSEVDEPEKIVLIDSSKTIWLMELEIVNLTKEPIAPIKGSGQLVLINQDGSKFNIFGDLHLGCSSKFAEKSKMRRLYFQSLVPKIKVIGTIPFQLPDDNEAVYSISLKKGSLCVV